MNETIDRSSLDNSECAVLVTGNVKNNTLHTRCQVQGDEHDIAIMVATVLEQVESLGLLDLVYEYYRNSPKNDLQKMVRLVNRNDFVS